MPRKTYPSDIKRKKEADAKAETRAAAMLVEKERQQTAFLAAFVEMGTDLRARQAVKLTKSVVEHWKATDPKFLLAYEAADEDIGQKLEGKAVDLALETAGGPGEKTLLTLLAARNERYRKNLNIRHSGPDGGPVGLAFTSPEAVKAQLIAVAHQFPTVAPIIRQTLSEVLEALPK